MKLKPINLLESNNAKCLCCGGVIYFDGMASKILFRLIYGFLYLQLCALAECRLRL